MTATQTAAVGSVRRPSLPVRTALALLKGYQAAASGRVSPCRFYPSCSNYAAEAFTVHGFWRGLALTARRLLRCRPFGPHGVDLVPLPAHAHPHEEGRT
jgi:putative membrane protein insertion efficiency factor